MEELGRLEERVILIGVQTAAEDNVLDSLDELEELVPQTYWPMPDYCELLFDL